MALLTHVTVQGSNAVTTGSIDTSGASLLVAALSRNDGSAANMADSKSNIWVLIDELAVGGNRIALFYVKNPSVGTGHTFSAGETGGFPTLLVSSYSGTDTSADVDQTNHATSGPTSVQTTVTPVMETVPVEPPPKKKLLFSWTNATAITGPGVPPEPKG